jgi:hypothetical protein
MPNISRPKNEIGKTSAGKRSTSQVEADSGLRSRSLDWPLLKVIRLAAKTLLPETVSLIDKAARKGVLHQNAAARHKSRLTLPRQWHEVDASHLREPLDQD